MRRRELLALALAIPLLPGPAPAQEQRVGRLEAGLPTMCEWRDMAARGCILAYGVDRAALRRRTADYIARILRGTPAGELPTEAPATFELAVNLRAAKSLGVEISASLLAQADEVVE